MDNTNDPLQRAKVNLIGAACAVQKMTGAAATMTPIPGDDRVIVVGTKAHVARLLELAPSTQVSQAPVEQAVWTDTPPTEQADYWHWDGDLDHAPMIYHVMWSGTAKKCFLSIGQYDITSAIWCDEFEGYWMKIEQPSVAAPTITAASAQTDVAESELFDMRDAILDALSRKAAPHAWESLVSETAYRFIVKRRNLEGQTGAATQDTKGGE